MAVGRRRILVVGASGAIGAALLACYRHRNPEAEFLACSRTLPATEAAGVAGLSLDLLDANSIAAAARAAEQGGPLDRVLVCTGLLHDAEHRPEKSLRELDAHWLQHSFAVNSTGPALLMQHFLPLLRRDAHTVFAVLSARVGSISDNRLGGWYSYRAAKAALNMLVATAAIELRRTHPQAVLLALHPGTVDSALSQPFQSRLRPGQLQTAHQAAASLHSVIEAAQPVQSGCCLAWDGTLVPP